MPGVIKIKQYDRNAEMQRINPATNPFVNVFDRNLIQGSGVAVSKSGTIFVSDAGRHIIWKLNEGTRPVLFAGKTNTPGFVNGTAANARFNTPKDIVADTADNLYVFDSGNHRIRKIDANGNISTVTQVNASIADASLTVSPSGDIYAVASGI